MLPAVSIRPVILLICAASDCPLHANYFLEIVNTIGQFRVRVCDIDNMHPCCGGMHLQRPSWWPGQLPELPRCWC